MSEVEISLEVIGLVIQGITLLLIAWYAWEARKQSEVMKKSVELTRDETEPHVWPHFSDDPHPKIVIKNYGYTPAEDISLRFNPNLKFMEDTSKPWLTPGEEYSARLETQ